MGLVHQFCDGSSMMQQVPGILGPKKCAAPAQACSSMMQPGALAAIKRALQLGYAHDRQIAQVIRSSPRAPSLPPHKRPLALGTVNSPAIGALCEGLHRVNCHGVFGVLQGLLQCLQVHGWLVPCMESSSVVLRCLLPARPRSTASSTVVLRCLLPARPRSTASSTVVLRCLLPARPRSTASSTAVLRCLLPAKQRAASSSPYFRCSTCLRQLEKELLAVTLSLSFCCLRQHATLSSAQQLPAEANRLAWTWATVILRRPTTKATQLVKLHREWYWDRAWQKPAFLQQSQSDRAVHSCHDAAPATLCGHK